MAVPQTPRVMPDEDDQHSSRGLDWTRVRQDLHGNFYFLDTDWNPLEVKVLYESLLLTLILIHV